MKNKYSGILYIAFLIMVAAVSGSIRGYLIAKRHQGSMDVTAAAGKQTGSASQHALSQIQQSLAKREYHISYDSLKQALQSPNRAQGLRAYYKPGKLTVINRKDSVGHNFKLELVNEGVFVDNIQLFKAKPTAKKDLKDNILHIRHNGFTEEYINDSSGIRQNFIVESVPAGTERLQVKLDARGMQVEERGSTELLLTSESGSKLYYRDLQCWDANKRPLDATMAYAGGRIRIDVAVSNATFPVTIDPLIVNGSPANADAILQANKAGAQMGYNVSTAGDINADGYGDVLVGAPQYDNGQAKEGAVFVYYGAATGLSTNNPQILEVNKAGALMGFSVSSAGDVNNDGFADIIVGAPLATNGHYAEGIALVYYGAAGGLPAQPSRLLEINQAESRMGFSVAGAGDVNGDGFSDIIVGAYAYDNNGMKDKGLTLIYLGSPAGIPAQANWSTEGTQSDGWEGYSVRGAGDVDGDGYSDVLSGAPTFDNGQTNEGIVKVYHGATSVIDQSKTKMIEGNENGGLLGFSVSTGGDINGDGFSDIILGAPLYTKGQYAEGVAFIHYGSATSIQMQPALVLEKNQAESRMGHSVACAGDINGDGFADIIVGAYLYDNGQKDEGMVYVYQGSKTGLNPTPISAIEGEQIDGYVGFNVAPAGDINGDGYSDIIAGSYAYDDGEKDEGAAFVWMGGVKTIDAKKQTIEYTNQLTALLGESVAAAGDVNGDGFSDVILGAPIYDNGHYNEGAIFIFFGGINGLSTNTPTILESNLIGAALGTSASSGDFNGDGYDDIVTGLPGYSNGQTKEGAIYIYLGNQAALPTIPSKVFESNFPLARLGHSVASAGDVNGDGFADVVAGAIEYNNGQLDEGKFYLFYGNSNGIDTQNFSSLESNLAATQLGSSVASAGDLDGNGFDDIVVGATSFGDDDQGKAYVFYGTPTGIDLVNSQSIVGLQAHEGLGCAVSCAGDINADGYSDLIIGAAGRDNGDGAAYLFYGSINKLNTGAPVVLKGSQKGTYANMGQAVSSAGDVNGDGYADIVVGVPWHLHPVSKELTGNALVFFGSPNGIEQIPLEINNTQPGTYAFMGWSVSGAGDINADGYDDILIGAPNYDPWQGEKDGVIVWYGNNGTGARNNLRLYNTDLATPINHNQFQQNNFGAGLYAKSFLGRGKGKLVWETKPAGQGFSKGSNNSITNSTQSTNAQNAYTNLGLAGLELKNLINKQGAGTKVRVRVKYHPALALTGQTYGPWRYLPAYLMGNSTSPVPENAENNLSQLTKSENMTDLNKWSEQVTVYPNPASDYLNITARHPDQVKTIKIMTITGFLVYQSRGFKSSIDLKSLSRGVYSVIVTNQDGVQTTRKIVIMK